MNSSNSDSGNVPAKPGRVLLTKGSIKLLASMNPESIIRSLNRSLGHSKTAASTQEVIDLIDASGISRLVFSVLGTPITAERLGIDQELRKRVLKADPFFLPNGTLRLKLPIELGGMKHVDLSGISEMRRKLTVSDSVSLSIPDLLTVDDTICIADVVSFSAPKLEIIEGPLMIFRSLSVNLPTLREIKDVLYVNHSLPMEFPGLRKVGGVSTHLPGHLEFPVLEQIGTRGLEVYGAKGMIFPYLERVAGNVYIRKTMDISFPKLGSISGTLTTEDSIGLLMSVLESV